MSILRDAIIQTKLSGFSPNRSFFYIDTRDAELGEDPHDTATLAIASKACARLSNLAVVELLYFKSMSRLRALEFS